MPFFCRQLPGLRVQTIPMTDILPQISNPSKGGPKTNSGKAVSRFNAVKHGILSSKALLNNEDPKFFAKFARKMMQELAPEGAVEFLLAERIITTAWRLRRLLDVERATMEYERDENIGREYLYYKGKEHAQKYIAREMVLNMYADKIMRYEATLERSLYRTLDKLTQIQASRTGQNTQRAIDIEAILRD